LKYLFNIKTKKYKIQKNIRFKTKSINQGENLPKLKKNWTPRLVDNSIFDDNLENFESSLSEDSLNSTNEIEKYRRDLRTSLDILDEILVSN